MMKRAVALLRGMSPVWRDLVSGKKAFITTKIIQEKEMLS